MAAHQTHLESLLKKQISRLCPIPTDLESHEPGRSKSVFLTSFSDVCGTVRLADPVFGHYWFRKHTGSVEKKKKTGQGGT